MPWANAPDYDAWWAEASAPREAGVAVDSGCVNRGVVGVAVPVEHEGALEHIIAAAMFETHDGPDTTAIGLRLQAVAALAADRCGSRPCTT